MAENQPLPQAVGYLKMKRQSLKRGSELGISVISDGFFNPTELNLSESDMIHDARMLLQSEILHGIAPSC